MLMRLRGLNRTLGSVLIVNVAYPGRFSIFITLIGPIQTKLKHAVVYTVAAQN